jgi:hypothetical protein
MPTVIGDLTLEPKATPPAADAAAGGAKASGGGAAKGPELERELDKIDRRQHERALRTWAH